MMNSRGNQNQLIVGLLGLLAPQHVKQATVCTSTSRVNYSNFGAG
jgi:hypothetical protein